MKRILFLPVLVQLLTGSIGMCVAIIYHEELTVEELELLFGDEMCIDGTLSASIDGNIFPKVTIVENLQKKEENNSSEIEDKTAMKQINDLADFNKISYYYNLTAEEGPAHHKRFFITLNLGDEEFKGIGNSINNAQHDAARLALKLTLYPHPSIKPVSDASFKKNMNPVYNLEKFISKRWDTKITYSFQERSMEELSKNHKNYFHEEMYSTPVIVHKATVEIEHLSFIGEGSTRESAKQAAANKALHELKKMHGHCVFNHEHESIWATTSKSPISLLMEFASKSKLTLGFYTSGEEGPAHMKIFTVKCHIGKNIKTIGKGHSKQSAKIEAAKNMINHLKKQASTKETNCDNLFTKNKKTKLKKENKLIKSISNKTPEKEYKHSLTYNNNPISKLLEIQHINNGIQPIYTLLQEKSEENTNFLMEVKVGNSIFVGSGPNKKTAKKNAAEGMLNNLGYTKTAEGIRVGVSGQKIKEFTSGHIPGTQKNLALGLNINSESFIKPVENKVITSVDSKTTVEANDRSQKKSESAHEKSSETSKNEIKSSTFKSPQGQLDNIAHTLNFRYQFSNFPMKNNPGFVSLVSLTTDPAKVCYGIGDSIVISQDNAARSALKDLYKSHLETISDILRSYDEDDEDFFKFGEKTLQEDFITEL